MEYITISKQQLIEKAWEKIKEMINDGLDCCDIYSAFIDYDSLIDELFKGGDKE